MQRRLKLLKKPKRRTPKRNKQFHKEISLSWNSFNNYYFLSYQKIDISIDDLDIFSNLIDKFINYDIFLKLNIKLTSWSINSLKVISNILSEIQSTPTKYYNSNFTYNSIVINSPSYEFVIKSTNKALMDQIYSEGSTIKESDFGQYIIKILQKYNEDIDYDIELERKDIF